MRYPAIIRVATTACPSALRAHDPTPPRPPANVAAHVPARRPAMHSTIQPPASRGVAQLRWQASARPACGLPPSVCREAGAGVHPLQRQLRPRGPESWLRARGAGRAAATRVGAELLLYLAAGLLLSMHLVVLSCNPLLHIHTSLVLVAGRSLCGPGWLWAWSWPRWLGRSGGFSPAARQ